MSERWIDELIPDAPQWARDLVDEQIESLRSRVAELEDSLAIAQFNCEAQAEANVMLRSRLAKLQGGEACCVTHGEGACQLTCAKCNDELRSRLAEANLNLAAVPTMCRRYEARLAEAVELLASARGKIDTLTIQGKGCQRDIDAFLAREGKP